MLTLQKLRQNIGNRKDKEFFMALNYNGKLWLNLQEQVEKNKEETYQTI